LYSSPPGAARLNSGTGSPAAILEDEAVDTAAEPISAADTADDTMNVVLDFDMRNLRSGYSKTDNTEELELSSRPQAVTARGDPRIIMAEDETCDRFSYSS
jgi:D-serine deaminase-like pyridoxal phosphate-dependent protein